MTLDTADIFNFLCSHYGARPDRRGEVHITCPFCGKEPGKSASPHCSFSLKGVKCFSCGQKGYSLNRFHAEYFREHKVLERPIQPIRVSVPERPKSPAFKMTWDEYTRRYVMGRPAVIEWQKYKPVPTTAINHFRLGYGQLPRSACKHNRLIVPITNNGGNISHLRGRSIECSCSKWTASGGWSADDMVPFGANLLPSWPSVVVITENPVDAIMVRSSKSGDIVQRMGGILVPQMNPDALRAMREWMDGNSPYPIAGIATLSVSYWSSSWLTWLHRANVVQIFVAYDNDLPGNGGAYKRNQFLDEWQAAAPDQSVQRPIPKNNGADLANKLLRANLPATLLNWGDRPRKFDIGDLLKGCRID